MQPCFKRYTWRYTKTEPQSDGKINILDRIPAQTQAGRTTPSEQPSPTARPTAGRGVPATMPTKTANSHKDHRNSDRNNSAHLNKYLSANQKRASNPPAGHTADGPPTPTTRAQQIPPPVRPASSSRRTKQKSSMIRTGLKSFSK